MDKSMVTGMVIGVAVATAAGAIAGFNLLADKKPEYAEVTNVSEIRKSYEVPREVCQDVAVTKQKPVKDEHKILGTVGGAVVGGLLGNQIGGGSGKKIATVAGAAAGGYAGNKVQGNMQKNDTYTEMERRCEMVTDTREEVVGYNVSYRIGDRTGQVRMDEKPGDRIPLQNGELLLTNVPQGE